MSETLMVRTIAEKKTYLIKVHGLTSSQMYDIDGKVLITRSGCDRLEKDNGVLTIIESIHVIPYDDKLAVVMHMTGKVPGDAIKYQTVATASPDTVIPGFNHYAEIAESRCRLRILFKALNLWEMEIMPEDGFKLPDKHSSETVTETAKKAFEKTQKTNRGKTPVRKNKPRKKA